MDVSTWLVLGGVSLLYVALGLWAVSQIFPTDTSSRDDSRATRESDLNRTE
ncbi:MAG: hypothetical protein ACOH2F_00295 [Cellulomonas sp.]